MHASGGLPGEDQCSGRGKQRVLSDEENETCCLFTHEDKIVKPTKHCLKEGGRESRGMGYKELVNFFKVHCMHV
jgi:hypothetical protein